MTTSWIFVCLGKHCLLHNIMLCLIKHCYITESYCNRTMFVSRMFSGADNIIALPSTFIDNLLNSSVQQLTDQIQHCGIDIFSYNMIIISYHCNGNKSLFVVMGAKHIKDYMKTDFSKTQPCILHILPYATFMQGHHHAYNQAVTLTHCNYAFDIDLMPFSRRYLLFTQPFGEPFQ